MSIREHTRAYVSIRLARALSASFFIFLISFLLSIFENFSVVEPKSSSFAPHPLSSLSRLLLFFFRSCMRQHTSAYVSIRQLVSSLALLLPLLLPLRIQHTSAYVSVRISIRQHPSAYVSLSRLLLFFFRSCSLSSFYLLY